MHYVTFEINETQRTQRTQPTQPATVHWGVTDGQTFWTLDGVSGFSTLLEMIEQGESAQAAIRMLAERAMSGALTVPTFTLAAVTLKAPYIPRYPIVCVGKNYADHAKELAAGGVMPDLPVPIFFTKAPYTVIGPWEEIDPHLGITEALDYEGEIAVIIGKEGRNIRPEEAMDYIFGYALLNDVTARDLQKAHQQYFKGKSLDTFAPWGPWITSAEHIEDLEALTFQTSVNGEVRQTGVVREMIFSIPHLIAQLSRGMTLPAGTVIATGTPSGVGAGMKPPRYLRPGDTIVISSEHLGTLENRVGGA